MIIVGASRHAKEILQIINENNLIVNYLFDNVSEYFDPYFDQYTILRSFEDERINNNIKFVLGLGGTLVRKTIYNNFLERGFLPLSIISNTSVIGLNAVMIGNGVNIMHFAFISDNVIIGDGALINAYSSIHHDVVVGNFTEISPRATILGGASIGDCTSIGAGAIILPNIKVGTNCIVGAGSIVTKNINDNELWFGNPAKFIKMIK